MQWNYHRNHPNLWQSVIWHSFCYLETGKTRKREVSLGHDSTTCGKPSLVNFINVLRANFTNKSLFGSFFYLHVTREKLLKRRLYITFACKMLMKLTPWEINTIFYWIKYHLLKTCSHLFSFYSFYCFYSPQWPWKIICYLSYQWEVIEGQMNILWDPISL